MIASLHSTATAHPFLLAILAAVAAVTLLGLIGRLRHFAHQAGELEPPTYTPYPSASPAATTEPITAEQHETAMAVFRQLMALQAADRSTGIHAPDFNALLQQLEDLNITPDEQGRAAYVAGCDAIASEHRARLVDPLCPPLAELQNSTIETANLTRATLPELTNAHAANTTATPPHS